jgi:hypothetical protein
MREIDDTSRKIFWMTIKMGTKGKMSYFKPTEKCA